MKAIAFTTCRDGQRGKDIVVLAIVLDCQAGDAGGVSRALHPGRGQAEVLWSDLGQEAHLVEPY